MIELRVHSDWNYLDVGWLDFKLWVKLSVCQD